MARAKWRHLTPPHATPTRLRSHRPALTAAQLRSRARVCTCMLACVLRTHACMGPGHEQARLHAKPSARAGDHRAARDGVLQSALPRKTRRNVPTIVKHFQECARVLSRAGAEAEINRQLYKARSRAHANAFRCMRTQLGSACARVHAQAYACASSCVHEHSGAPPSVRVRAHALPCVVTSGSPEHVHMCNARAHAHARIRAHAGSPAQPAHPIDPDWWPLPETHLRLTRDPPETQPRLT